MTTSIQNHSATVPPPDPYAKGAYRLLDPALLASMAEDIHDILTVISGHTWLIEADSQAGDLYNEDLAGISEAVTRGTVVSRRLAYLAENALWPKGAEQSPGGER
jgi:hypothetical protein